MKSNEIQKADKGELRQLWENHMKIIGKAMKTVGKTTNARGNAMRSL